jgi:hypothetical protein
MQIGIKRKLGVIDVNDSVVHETRCPTIWRFASLKGVLSHQWLIRPIARDQNYLLGHEIYQYASYHM